MEKLEITLPDATAARLADAAAAANVPTAGYAAALVAEALEVGVFGVQTPPQAATAASAGAAAPDVPDDASLASLALCFLRGDPEGAAVILRDTSLPLLLADAVAWINRIGVDSLGPEGWDARLQAALGDAAARRAAD